ncbi:MAG: heavy-metal-associated domain-containing protein [Ferruginibacter sp.]|nr:heavy-metal-associated domain-containing protein [Ferruginibacter sp.]
MKKILLIAFVFVTTSISAQINKVTLQASGLTCSMCSNSINKSLKTLDFVENVEANIKTSSFILTIKQNSNANLDAIKAKVEDAGFFVAKMTASVSFNNTTVKNDEHIKIGNEVYHFLNITAQQLNGEQQIKILDKGFVTAKEYKRNNKLTTMNCYTTGKAASCCAKEGITEGQRIYHVTL